MTGKMFLIDGHALIFKMYYAFLGRPMVNSKGLDTSILYGFTKYLLELVDRERPTHLAVSFDPPGGTFRNVMYPEYKANRGETPQLVIDALEPLTGIVRSLGIPVIMMMGYEADDVIGSLAKRSAREGFDVYMVTPDKDYGQLVEEHIFQYKPAKGGENEVYGPQGICDKYRIARPEQVIDMLTICGDSADNVPGVKGVGEVGAAKLLAKYDSVEKIYAHLDELTERQRAMFADAQDHIALSRQLVTIKTDIEIDVKADDMLLNMAFTPEVADLFSLYEFNSLRRHFAPAAAALKGRAAEVGMAGPSRTLPPSSYDAGGVMFPSASLPHSCGKTESGEFENRCPLLSWLLQNDEAPTADLSDLKAENGIAIEVSVDRIRLSDGEKIATAGLRDSKAILENAATVKIGYALKPQIEILAENGINLDGEMRDIEIMHYLLNPEKNHSLEILSKSILGVDLIPQTENTASSLFDEEQSDAENLPLKVASVFALGCKLWDELEASGLNKLYHDIEEPLIGVLARMEMTGVRIDADSLKDFADSLRREMQASEAVVREIAGEPNLNVGSPRQLGEVLFEKLKLDPKAKKPKKGSWPTDEETLLGLSDRSPIIDSVLQYRGTRKLLSTYIEPLPSYISPADGRVHTTFNQALTSTGRLSSSNPNLQNIPVRTEQGRRIREAFVPQDAGSVMMSADYSQIELRIMAHLSCDPQLTAAFRSGEDVHAATAAKIFGVPAAEVTAEQRRVAKTANFGIMYGISAFGLAQRLRCPRSEAKQLIDDYFASFQSIKSFIDDTLVAARETGYVETLFGRRRYIQDINSGNATMRALAERNAVNAPIQGSAADIIKLAMIAVDSRLRQGGFKSRMVLQIHDELLLEVPQDEIQQVGSLVCECMEGVACLSVPLTVECNYGKTWLAAH